MRRGRSLRRDGILRELQRGSGARRHKVADDPFPAPSVLILGPTGVGKELLARAIHLKGGGKPDGFGAINCGGLSPDLLESELFGHARGAFTGAGAKKDGFVERYETVFLDEVGDMPPDIQVRLLRFLNSGEFRAVGDNEIKRKTPRIISATNLELDARVKAGTFREDLYHRLRGRVLLLRPLRERLASIPLIIGEFLAVVREARAESAPKLSTEALYALAAYSWPGNMREMRYVAESIVDRAGGRETVQFIDLPIEIQREYSEHVDPILQTALAMHPGQSPREDTEAQALMIRFELSRAAALRQSPQATAHRRLAAVARGIAGSLGVANQVEAQARALEVSAQIQELEDREIALRRLRESASALNLDIARPIETELDATQRQLSSLRTDQKQAGAKAKKDLGRYAAAIVVTLLWKIVPLSGSEFLDKIEAIAAAIAKPPVDDAARALGRWVRGVSANDLKRAWREFKTSLDDENADSELDWSEISSSRNRLRTAYKGARWNQGELARRCGVRPETVQRKLKQFEIQRPGGKK